MHMQTEERCQSEWAAPCGAPRAGLGFSALLKFTSGGELAPLPLPVHLHVDTSKSPC